MVEVVEEVVGTTIGVVDVVEVVDVVDVVLEELEPILAIGLKFLGN